MHSNSDAPDARTARPKAAKAAIFQPKLIYSQMIYE